MGSEMCIRDSHKFINIFGSFLASYTKLFHLLIEEVNVFLKVHIIIEFGRFFLPREAYEEMQKLWKESLYNFLPGLIKISPIFFLLSRHNFPQLSLLCWVDFGYWSDGFLCQSCNILLYSQNQPNLPIFSPKSCMHPIALIECLLL